MAVWAVCKLVALTGTPLNSNMLYGVASDLVEAPLTSVKPLMATLGYVVT